MTRPVLFMVAVALAAFAAANEWERHPSLPSVLRLKARTLGTVADVLASGLPSWTGVNTGSLQPVSIDLARIPGLYATAA